MVTILTHLFVICVSSAAKFPFKRMAHLKLVFNCNFTFLLFACFLLLLNVETS